MADGWESMAVVGTIVRPHGIRGQVVVHPETDFPDRRFAVGEVLHIRRGTALVPLVVSSARLHRGRPIVGVEGVEDASSAETLRGAELRIPVAALSPLPAGSFYRHDLAGCRVRTVGGEAVGEVLRVEGSLGQSWLVVDREGDEVLIPLVDRVCVQIDPEARAITIDPPAGLLEVNASTRPSSTEARA
jgi:16S rRNA processing protein RimM